MVNQITYFKIETQIIYLSNDIIVLIKWSELCNGSKKKQLNLKDFFLRLSYNPHIKKGKLIPKISWELEI